MVPQQDIISVLFGWDLKQPETNYDSRLDTMVSETTRRLFMQVHAAAVASDSYTPASAVSDLEWLGSSRFRCQVDVQLADYQWPQLGDLAVLNGERACEIVTLQGTLQRIAGGKACGPQAQGMSLKRFQVEVELSDIAKYARDAQKDFLQLSQLRQIVVFWEGRKPFEQPWPFPFYPFSLL